MKAPARALLRLTVLVCGTATAARAATPSFDCSTASTASIEELICQDDQLAALDVKLAEVYAEAEKKVPRAKPNGLRAEQNGWSQARTECGKADDRRECALELYQLRIAGLQASYGLVAANGPHTWFCNNDSKNEVLVTYFPTDPPTLLAKKHGQTSLMYLQPSGSGSKYVGPNESFWEHQNEALVTWGFRAPQIICQRKP